MRNYILHLLTITFAIVVCSSINADSAQLSREQQLELIGYYKLIHDGVGGVPSEAQEMLKLDDVNFPVKCATPITIPYAANLKFFDKDLVDKHSLTLAARPTETDEFYDSPSGNFKIHFTRSGSHAVYQSNVTTGGVPNYVIGVGQIFDSVFSHIIGDLGYPQPPMDGGYPSGIDDRYDVYLINLGGSFFGLTYPDSLPFTGGGSLDATSFIEVDNDFQESGFGPYRNQPLNAVRVTAAHEYFHAVHFGIDFTEMEDFTDPVFRRPYWYEMTSTWMEEEIYDDINDYYAVLPYFFSVPRSSIQQFSSPLDFHPYASCVFPLFLSEAYGPDIIREIWLRCGQLGIGPNMLEAANIVIDSISGGSENFRSVFGEFTLWNFFTGSRANSAPGGVGYQERASYPEIPDTAFTNVFQYPVTQDAFTNPRRPAVNSAEYFKLNNTRAIFYTDSADTQLRVSMILGGVVADSALPQGWQISRLAQLDSDPSVYTDTTGSYADNANHFLRTNDPRQYRSITYILAPASYRTEAYSSPDYDTRYGYIITDSLALSPSKQPLILHPFPNPANVSNMNGGDLTFRFQIATDSVGSPVYGSSFSLIDIFSSAGELIQTIETDAPTIIVDPVTGDAYYDVGWDMTNQQGKEVASGVYICYARFFENKSQSNLLGEEKAKVLIVR